MIRLSSYCSNYFYLTVQCRQRWQKVLRPGLNKGKWTKEEDKHLVDAVAKNLSSWGKVAELVPGRTSKQCRERWCHHVSFL